MVFVKLKKLSFKWSPNYLKFSPSMKFREQQIENAPVSFKKNMGASAT
jgi:hypothetical protein